MAANEVTRQRASQAKTLNLNQGRPDYTQEPPEQITPEYLEQRNQTGFFTNQDPETSRWDVRRAQAQLTRVDTSTALVMRFGERMLDNSQEAMNPDELNSMFPEMQGAFKNPMTVNSAMQIAATEERRRELQEIINSGDPDSWRQKIEGLAIGIGVHVLDPVGMATGFGIGAGFSRLAGMALSRSGSVATAAQAVARRPVLRAGLEGGVGSGIEEAALAIPLMKEELQDINTMENVGISMAAGSIFGAGLSALARTSVPQRLLRKDADTSEKAFTLVEQQLEAGKRADVDPYIRAVADKELPTLRKDLEEARTRGDEARAQEIEETIEYAQSHPPEPRTEAATRQYSEEADLDYDPELPQRIRDVEERIPTETESFLTSRFQELENRFTGLEQDGAEIPPSLRKSFDESKAEISRIEETENAFLEYTNCLRGAA